MLIQNFLFHRVLGKVKVLIKNFLFHRVLGEVNLEQAGGQQGGGQ